MNPQEPVRKGLVRPRNRRSHHGKMYNELSPLYDGFFFPFFGPRIRATIRSLDISPGAKVLEVGVGTGLSLPAYPSHASVTGVDLSDKMLDRARRKVDRNGWDHVNLQQMDALDLEFPDEHFDYVTAFHVVSVVPDSERLMREMLRVVKTGGGVVIINHFRTERKWLSPFVGLLNPFTRRMGWHMNLRFSDVFESRPLRVERRFRTSTRSLFTVVVARKTTPC